MSNKKLIITIVCIALALCLGIGAGIGIYNSNKKSGSASKGDVSEKEDDGEYIAETRDGKKQSYLTGEWVDESIADTRAVAVMVENTKECQPQYGLNKAGIIYECPVEGSYTRMMAIYDDLEGVTQIGNVRSCRPYFAYIAMEYDAIYAHFGQSIHAVALLESGRIDDLNGLNGEGNVTFYRTSEHPAPHNAYANAESLQKGIEYKKFRTEYKDSFNGKFKFTTDDEINVNGEDCKVVVPYFFYNKPWFIYDEGTGLYKRYQFGGEEIDKLDNTQVAVKNIIFQNVDSAIYEGTQYLNLTLVGSGKGKYITNGKVEDITWKKTSEDDITRYYDADGNEITLNQGQTWVCLIQNQYADKNQFYSTVEEYENR